MPLFTVYTLRAFDKSTSEAATGVETHFIHTHCESTIV